MLLSLVIRPGCNIFEMIEIESIARISAFLSPNINIQHVSKVVTRFDVSLKVLVLRRNDKAPECATASSSCKVQSRARGKVQPNIESESFCKSNLLKPGLRRYTMATGARNSGLIT